MSTSISKQSMSLPPFRWLVCKAVTLICAGMDRRRTNGFFTYAQIVGAAAMSFMHGAQDGQKFIGVLFLGMAFCNGQPSVTGVMILVWLMILCSTIMGVGAVRRLSAINFGVVRDMMLTWVFTFPGCGLISFVMAKLFMVVF